MAMYERWEYMCLVTGLESSDIARTVVTHQNGMQVADANKDNRIGPPFLQDYLNERGTQGWELAGVLSTGVLVLKRRVG